MRLEWGGSDIRCPRCDKLFDIDTTYEERQIDCRGEINCPNCAAHLWIESELKFTATIKRRKRK